LAVTVQEEIFEWVQQFEPWKQELFIRATASPRLSEADAREIADLLLGEQGEGVQLREVKPEDLPQGAQAGAAMAILRIEELRNVNAIEDGQALGFEVAGVNVVWGANGAGKTGYSRVLKKAGRTLYPEEVLSNVYREASGGPQATVVVKVGEDEHAVELDLNAEGPALLGRICISDARAGEVYLTKETEVDYVPTTLSSLSRLAAGLDAVRAVLERRRAEVQVPQIDLKPFGEGTRASAAVAGIDAETSEESLRVLAKLSAEEETERAALRKRAGEIEAMQAPQLRAIALREAAEARRLRDDLRSLGGVLEAAAIEAARERKRSLREAREAADLVARSFEAEPLGEIGSQPWRALWNAAREYVAHLGQALPAEHDPAHCPLCMQELGEDAKARLRSFEEFVGSDVNTRLAKLQVEDEQVLAQLPDVDAIEVSHRSVIETLGEEEPSGEAIKQWLGLARGGIERLRKAELDDLDPLPAPPDLDAWIEGREAEAERQAEIERAEEKDKVRTELAELDGRALLGERLEDVLALLAARKEVDRIGKAIEKTSTGGVSRKIGSFSQELIQSGLEQALNRQLEALEFRDIEVVPKTRTVRGQPLTSLAFRSVEGVPLTSVLSHGEQRRLALTMFLAEMEVRSDSSPVVFDDPTSSIDQEGRRRIARTLLKLGEQRQVIVFTHELSLVVELQRHSSAACEVFAQHVKRLGKTVGHVQPSLPWEGLSPRERLGDLDQKLVKLSAEYEKNDEENYAPQAAHFCSLLRAAFERAVEDSVLGGVVTRRSDSVQTQKLRAINWSTSICDLVDRGMSENSPWVHDQPLADGSTPPSPDELKEGLDVYSQLLTEVSQLKKGREDAAEKRKKERVAALKAVDLAPSGDGDESLLKPVPDPPAADIGARGDGERPDGDQLELE
jgi:hypothetical protein